MPSGRNPLGARGPTAQMPDAVGIRPSWAVGARGDAPPAGTPRPAPARVSRDRPGTGWDQVDVVLDVLALPPSEPVRS
jgi:hypothetical protein